MTHTQDDAGRGGLTGQPQRVAGGSGAAPDAAGQLDASHAVSTPEESQGTPQLTRRQRREQERAEAALRPRTGPIPIVAAEPAAVTGAQRAIGAALGRPRPKGHHAWAMALLAAAIILILPLGIFLAVGRPHEDGQDIPTPVQTVAGDAPLSSVLDVAGRLGSVPVISLKAVVEPPPQLITDTLITGTGRKLEVGDGIVLSVATFSGRDGANTTGTDSGRRLYRGILEPTYLGEDLARIVTGAAEGSRIVMRAAVAQDGGAESEITVVDILPTLAQGTAQAAPSGIPGVSFDDTGALTVSLGGLTPPTQGTTSVLIKGEGEQIKATDKIIARYAIAGWDTGTVRSSSYGWQVSPAVLDMSHTLSGLAQRLTDVQVGSRVLVELPADQARGDSAVAIVVDVLAVANDAAAEATATPTDDVVKVSPHN